MQCPNCRTEVDPNSAFCPNCGTKLTAAAQPVPPPQAGYSTAPPPPSYVPPATTASGLSANAAAAIAYITFIPAVIFLLLEPYNRIPFVRFHSVQSIGFTIAAVILHIAVRIVFAPFSWILFSMMESLLSLALFIVWIMVALKASRGEWYKLPVIGDIALRQSQG